MGIQTKADKIWNRVIAAFAGVVVLTLAITGILVLGGSGHRAYSQATPDDVIKSAVLMVKNGDAHRLPDLIYADNEDMRGSLRRLGVLLGNIQKLALAIRTRFPEDIQRYRADAEAAIAKGKPPAAFAALMDTFTNRDGPPTEAQEEVIRDLIGRIFADPYAWIEENEHRLSTVEVTEDIASILVDGKPAMGVGISLKLEDDKWYVALPTNFPAVARIMPKAPEQWRMINSFLKILDNTAVELTDDVTQGRLNNLKAIGDKAQEKIIFPGALWAAAYAADMDARRRIDNNARQYRERQKAWVKSRAGDVSEKLVASLNKIAAKEIDPLVRARKTVRWADLSDADFELRVSEWLNKYKIAVDLSGKLTGESVDAAVAQWEARAASELAKKSPKFERR